MKISKLLNKKNYLFFLFFIFFSISSANEPVDIWNIDKSETESNQDHQNETTVINESEQSVSIYDLNNQTKNENQNVVLQENKIENKISLYGLYDPDTTNGVYHPKPCGP